jgi:hypothetical protein
VWLWVMPMIQQSCFGPSAASYSWQRLDRASKPDWAGGEFGVRAESLCRWHHFRPGRDQYLVRERCLRCGRPAQEFRLDGNPRIPISS